MKKLLNYPMNKTYADLESVGWKRGIGAITKCCARTAWARRASGVTRHTRNLTVFFYLAHITPATAEVFNLYCRTVGISCTENGCALQTDSIINRYGFALFYQTANVKSFSHYEVDEYKSIKLNGQPLPPQSKFEFSPDRITIKVFNRATCKAAFCLASDMAIDRKSGFVSSVEYHTDGTIDGLTLGKPWFHTYGYCDAAIERKF